ncbi:MAG: cytochrome P450 [Acidimicrobiaceae bacterium]|nr:cytochrome P450 [Acidimicrobiaceae bacterium]MYA74895.1 cytochrome P450 [Acidimicrobiaceae bacterium]MYD05723.1 cytochrome P450 [Acidimicrobiaceae bacterium]MYG56057.1 cytochrome P450 [Acidimicrobiaceae bacterium]MYI57748.1 cytochrome P450 [Acidimicrobiaceae bacterium]
MGPDDADITSHDTYTNGVPHATFNRLRSCDPVHWTAETDGSGFWSILRYDDALAVSRDYDTFTSTKGIRLEEMDEEQLLARRTMMELDPPEHTRYRRLVNKGFTRRTVDTFEDVIRQLAAEVVETALPKGEFDFVAEISEQLPMRMLGRLLGTSDEHGHQLVAWGDALLGNTDPDFTDFPVDLTDTEQYRMVPFRSPAALEIFQFAQQQAKERRSCPRDDIITKLLEPTRDGDPLSDLEFNNFFTLLVAAGNDTTRYTMTHGVWNMMNHPRLWNTLRERPDLMISGVEEVLRTSSVTMHFRRTATRDIEMRGRRIKAGDKVVIWFNSANHDPDGFPVPFRFDLAREKNDHMAFGRNGPHFCLGAWLARMEVRLVFEELMKRIDHLEPAGPIERLRSNFISGIKRLPVKVI